MTSTDAPLAGMRTTHSTMIAEATRAAGNPARPARGLGAVVVALCATGAAAAPLPATVDTPLLTFTGIGDTIAPPGATMKVLPKTAATAPLTFTGIGDTVAPPGATAKPLPAQVNTEGIVMTGTGG